MEGKPGYDQSTFKQLGSPLALLSFPGPPPFPSGSSLVSPSIQRTSFSQSLDEDNMRRVHLGAAWNLWSQGKTRKTKY